MARSGEVAMSTVLERLQEKFPDARYELDWTTPLELLIATILAAQCTDVRVNKVTKTLFPKYRTAKDYAEANTEELEQILQPTGAYRQKAKAVQETCRALCERHGGEVPQTMAELTALRGVARKTANVVLNNAWDIASGIIVDTHVARVSQRMGLTTQEKPEAIERDLMHMVPEARWTKFGPAMVLHGRYTCTAKAPQCGDCMFSDVCPRNDV
ncbi:MAG TPA: endonuclease III [Polyangium sp.]|uniref:Endonuclease III n=1 Tax=Polyangium mundeleinium TaxID=2995306 RepID=A0ABT5ENZ7_9BACT|nr:endonuclease III [Polyangium mundeleinium]MDC0742480.1 endonuclease III [Polyangium mundeleinium]HVK71301.1 endonuclease III [Polyangium sp.]